GRRDGLLGLLIRSRGQAAFGVNNFFPRLRSSLPAHLGKERGKTVIILLAPFFKRMMMALGALKSQAKEKLGCVFELRIGVVDLPIPGHRRILGEVAGRRYDLSRKLVVRFVDQQTVADPAVKGIRAACVSRTASFIPQQRAPFISKVIGVI